MAGNPLVTSADRASELLEHAVVRAAADGYAGIVAGTVEWPVEAIGVRLLAGP
jgi:hypothetical protein